MIGATYGRLVGMLMVHMYGQDNTDEGTYALLGAASFLGGSMRMTVSLCVIMVEITNNLNLLPLIMLVLLVSKAVGDGLNAGFYDLHAQLRGIPILEAQSQRFMRMLSARDAASTKVVYFARVEMVGRIAEVLRSTSHNGYPVLQDLPDGQTVLAGLILRSPLPPPFSTPSPCLSNTPHTVLPNPPPPTPHLCSALYALPGQLLFLSSPSNLSTRPQLLPLLLPTPSPPSPPLSPPPPHPFPPPLPTPSPPPPSPPLPPPSPPFPSLPPLPISSLCSLGSYSFSDFAKPVSTKGISIGGIELSRELFGVPSPIPPAPTISPLSLRSLGSYSFSDFAKPVSTKGITIGDIELSREDLTLWIDLGPFLNPTPFIVDENMSLTKVHTLFRQLGLRHLCVVPPPSRAVGIITRKDLLPEILEERHAEFEDLTWEEGEIETFTPRLLRRGSSAAPQSPVPHLQQQPMEVQLREMGAREEPAVFMPAAALMQVHAYRQGKCNHQHQ
ncbi:unnamed protein product [Closterium sp. Yama58-4]|nr:unnamed protein product [Closterium sp. Yama58-4]